MNTVRELVLGLVTNRDAFPPLFIYDGTPFELYYQPFPEPFWRNTSLIGRELDDANLIILIFSDNLHRAEPQIMAIINSVEYTP